MAEAKKQENFFRRTVNRVSKWFREMRAELKKVAWPSKKQVLQNTLVVIVSVVVVGVCVWIFDAVSSIIVQALIGIAN